MTVNKHSELEVDSDASSWEWSEKIDRSENTRDDEEANILTCPFSSSKLLVNFSLSKETTFFIHAAPVWGESGWTWKRPGQCGSAFPATTQLELAEKKRKHISCDSNERMSSTCKRRNDIVYHPMEWNQPWADKSPKDPCRRVSLVKLETFV